MFFSDFKYIVSWWLTINIFAISFLPLTFYIFPKFFDRGYIFSKILSLSLVTYIILCLSVIKLLPFTNLAIIGVLIIINLINVYFLKSKYKSFIAITKKIYKYIILEELLFFLILVIWSIVRSYAPDIEGLEKFMDWGFVNSAMRSTYLPPADMWYAGSYINYYYFGHLIFAILTKISAIPSSITYNLSIATLCSLVFVSAFSLVANLAYKHKSFLLAGFFSALLLTFGGNLHPIYKILKINSTVHNLQKSAESYWYPDATRFIGFDPDINNKTIHEFPLYSFVVSDLHGHLNDIPLVLLLLAFLFSYSQSFKKTKIDYKLIIGTSLLLSFAYMTNAWDFAVYGLFFAVFLLFFQKNIFITMVTGILTIVFWYIFTLPYSQNFTPMADGIRLVDVRSPFWQLCVLYGGFWLLSLPFVVWFIKNIFKKYKFENVDIFAISLIIVATILVTIPEIIYVKDIYIFEHRRANTMFKLVYEAFIMYALVSGYILIKFRQSILYRTLFFIILISQLIYPYFAIKSYSDSHSKRQYWGLLGTDYLKTNFPDNFAVINWLNTNVSGQPHILEAVGDSYSKYNQISSATGLPTIEGWLVHEWLWRGGFDGPGARNTEVTTIYETKDANVALPILQKYSVKYIIIGDQEREKYKNLEESKFLNFSKIVFQSGKTKLYEMN
ncbi:MAG: DUF2298 domain-containing protein [Candidatus Shapirobacteria bacterium]